jgi:hypothetical protein
MNNTELMERLPLLVSTLAEDTIFVLSGDDGGVAVPRFDAFARRRAHTYATVLQGAPHPTMTRAFDAWVAELARAIAPIAAPDWLPMGQIVRSHVTLEGGAHGLRSIFSDKPSDKDTLRVRRLGTLAVRLLKQVLSANRPLDQEDARTLGALIASLGLAAEDADTLYREPIAPGLPVDVFGEVEAKVARAVLDGAWLAAAWDGLHPREEEVIRAFASKVGIALDAVEEARAVALNRVEVKRLIGLATVDYARAVLQDRVPGVGETLPFLLATLLLPRRYREEGLAPIRHGAPVVLAKRYAKLTHDERVRVLGMTWAAALHEDPSMSRQTLLRARFEHVAEDIEADSREARVLVSGWMSDVLAATAKEMAVPASG